MTILKIEGMSCQHCVKAVENAINAVEGIRSLSVKIGEARFEASSPEAAKAAALAVADAGYTVLKSSEAR